MIAGNWNAATARDGLGDDAEFFNMPPGESGDAVNIGSTSFPMHISAKTKQPGPRGGVPRLDHRAVRRPGAGRHPAGAGGDRRHRRAGRPARPGGQGGLGPARRGRRPDAVPRLVVADDAADDGPVVPGDAGRPDLAGGRDRSASRTTGRSTTSSSRGASRVTQVETSRAPRARRPASRRGCASARPASPAGSRTCTSLPAFVFYLLFAFGPLLYTAWLSFFDWDGLTVGTWVGLDNYDEVLQRPGHPRVVRPLVRADLLLRAAAVRARAAARLADRAQPRARGDVLPRRAVPAPDDRHRRRRDRLGVDLRAGRAAQRGAARGRPGQRRARLARRLRPGRCRRSAWSARG